MSFVPVRDWGSWKSNYESETLSYYGSHKNKALQELAAFDIYHQQMKFHSHGVICQSFVQLLKSSEHTAVLQVVDSI
jgi:hypothetical protein